jgi:putative salt-induced outer membrane protein
MTLEDPRVRRSSTAALTFLAAVGAAPSAFAQQAPTGAPPPEAKVLVEAPKSDFEAPKKEKKVDGTSVSASAGGLLTTGNSRLLAISGNGVYETRFNANGIGASVLGNYGRGAASLGDKVETTAENVQGRVRYDRFLIEDLALFLINTGRHDRFQGLDFRYNLDPGAKYLFLDRAASTLWAELGYDFQYDVRRNADRTVLDADKKPVIDPATGQPERLDRTAADHSIRAFVGHKHGFNKEVTLSLGVEYLQSIVEVTRYRVNGDALFAAKVAGGLAVGVGLSARFDHHPLPGKEKLDTATTLSLIYSFSDAAAPAAKTCPCPEPAPASLQEPPVPPVPPPPAPPPPAGPPSSNPTP